MSETSNTTSNRGRTKLPIGSLVAESNSGNIGEVRQPQPPSQQRILGAPSGSGTSGVKAPRQQQQQQQQQRAHSMAERKEYMKKHNLANILNNVAADILEAQPTNPTQYLQEFLETIADEQDRKRLLEEAERKGETPSAEALLPGLRAVNRARSASRERPGSAVGGRGKPAGSLFRQRLPLGAEPSASNSPVARPQDDTENFIRESEKETLAEMQKLKEEVLRFQQQKKRQIDESVEAKDSNTEKPREAPEPPALSPHPPQRRESHPLSASNSENHTDAQQQQQEQEASVSAGAGAEPVVAVITVENPQLVQFDAFEISKSTQNQGAGVISPTTQQINATGVGSTLATARGEDFDFEDEDNLPPLSTSKNRPSNSSSSSSITSSANSSVLTPPNKSATEHPQQQPSRKIQYSPGGSTTNPKLTGSTNSNNSSKLTGSTNSISAILGGEDLQASSTEKGGVTKAPVGIVALLTDKQNDSRSSQGWVGEVQRGTASNKSDTDDDVSIPTISTSHQTIVEVPDGRPGSSAKGVRSGSPSSASFTSSTKNNSGNRNLGIMGGSSSLASLAQASNTESKSGFEFYSSLYDKGLEDGIFAGLPPQQKEIPYTKEELPPPATAGNETGTFSPPAEKGEPRQQEEETFVVSVNTGNRLPQHRGSVLGHTDSTSTVDSDDMERDFLDALEDLWPAKLASFSPVAKHLGSWFLEHLSCNVSRSSLFTSENAPLSGHVHSGHSANLEFVMIRLQLIALATGNNIHCVSELILLACYDAYQMVHPTQLGQVERWSCSMNIRTTLLKLEKYSVEHLDPRTVGPLNWTDHIGEALKKLSHTSRFASRVPVVAVQAFAEKFVAFATKSQPFERDDITGISRPKPLSEMAPLDPDLLRFASDPQFIALASNLLYALELPSTVYSYPSITVSLFTQKILLAAKFSTSHKIARGYMLPYPENLFRCGALWRRHSVWLQELVRVSLSRTVAKVGKTPRFTLSVSDFFVNEVLEYFFGSNFDATKWDDDLAQLVVEKLWGPNHLTSSHSNAGAAGHHGGETGEASAGQLPTMLKGGEAEVDMIKKRLDSGPLDREDTMAPGTTPPPITPAFLSGESEDNDDLGNPLGASSGSPSQLQQPLHTTIEQDAPVSKELLIAAAFEVSSYSFAGYDVLSLLNAHPVVDFKDLLLNHARKPTMPGKRRKSSNSALGASGSSSTSSVEISAEYTQRFLSELVKEILRALASLGRANAEITRKGKDELSMSGVDFNEVLSPSDADLAQVGLPKLLQMDFSSFFVSCVWLLSLRNVSPVGADLAEKQNIGTYYNDNHGAVAEGEDSESGGSDEKEEENEALGWSAMDDSYTGHKLMAAANGGEDEGVVAPATMCFNSISIALLYTQWTLIRDTYFPIYGTSLTHNILAELSIPHRTLYDSDSISDIGNHLRQTIDAAVAQLVVHGEAQMRHTFLEKMQSHPATAAIVASSITWKVLVLTIVNFSLLLTSQLFSNSAQKNGAQEQQPELQQTATSKGEQLRLEEEYNKLYQVWLSFGTSLILGFQSQKEQASVSAGNSTTDKKALKPPALQKPVQNNATSTPTSVSEEFFYSVELRKLMLCTPKKLAATMSAYNMQNPDQSTQQLNDLALLSLPDKEALLDRTETAAALAAASLPSCTASNDQQLANSAWPFITPVGGSSKSNHPQQHQQPSMTTKASALLHAAFYSILSSRSMEVVVTVGGDATTSSASGTTPLQNATNGGASPAAETFYSKQLRAILKQQEQQAAAAGAAPASCEDPRKFSPGTVASNGSAGEGTMGKRQQPAPPQPILQLQPINGWPQHAKGLSGSASTPASGFISINNVTTESSDSNSGSQNSSANDNGRLIGGGGQKQLRSSHHPSSLFTTICRKLSALTCDLPYTKNLMSGAVAIVCCMFSWFSTGSCSLVKTRQMFGHRIVDALHTFAEVADQQHGDGEEFLSEAGGAGEMPPLGKFRDSSKSRAGAFSGTSVAAITAIRAILLKHPLVASALVEHFFEIWMIILCSFEEINPSFAASTTPRGTAVPTVSVLCYMMCQGMDLALSYLMTILPTSQAGKLKAQLLESHLLSSTTGAPATPSVGKKGEGVEGSEKVPVCELAGKLYKNSVEHWRSSSRNMSHSPLRCQTILTFAAALNMKGLPHLAQMVLISFCTTDESEFGVVARKKLETEIVRLQFSLAEEEDSKGKTNSSFFSPLQSAIDDVAQQCKTFAEAIKCEKVDLPDTRMSIVHAMNAEGVAELREVRQQQRAGKNTNTSTTQRRDEEVDIVRRCASTIVGEMESTLKACTVIASGAPNVGDLFFNVFSSVDAEIQAMLKAAGTGASNNSSYAGGEHSVYQRIALPSSGSSPNKTSSAQAKSGSSKKSSGGVGTAHGESSSASLQTLAEKTVHRFLLSFPLCQPDAERLVVVVQYLLVASFFSFRAAQYFLSNVVQFFAGYGVCLKQLLLNELDPFYDGMANLQGTYAQIIACLKEESGTSAAKTKPGSTVLDYLSRFLIDALFDNRSLADDRGEEKNVATAAAGTETSSAGSAATARSLLSSHFAFQGMVEILSGILSAPVSVQDVELCELMVLRCDVNTQMVTFDGMTMSFSGGSEQSQSVHALSSFAEWSHTDPLEFGATGGGGKHSILGLDSTPEEAAAAAHISDSFAFFSRQVTPVLPSSGHITPSTLFRLYQALHKVFAACRGIVNQVNYQQHAAEESPQEQLEQLRKEESPHGQNADVVSLVSILLELGCSTPRHIYKIFVCIVNDVANTNSLLYEDICCLEESKLCGNALMRVYPVLCEAVLATQDILSREHSDHTATVKRKYLQSQSCKRTQQMQQETPPTMPPPTTAATATAGKNTADNSSRHLLPKDPLKLWMSGHFVTIQKQIIEKCTGDNDAFQSFNSGNLEHTGEENNSGSYSKDYSSIQSFAGAVNMAQSPTVVKVLQRIDWVVISQLAETSSATTPGGGAGDQLFSSSGNNKKLRLLSNLNSDRSIGAAGTEGFSAVAALSKVGKFLEFVANGGYTKIYATFEMYVELLRLGIDQLSELQKLGSLIFTWLFARLDDLENNASNNSPVARQEASKADNDVGGERGTGKKTKAMSFSGLVDTETGEPKVQPVPVTDPNVKVSSLSTFSAATSKSSASSIAAVITRENVMHFASWWLALEKSCDAAVKASPLFSMTSTELMIVVNGLQRSDTAAPPQPGGGPSTSTVASGSGPSGGLLNVSQTQLSALFQSKSQLKSLLAPSQQTTMNKILVAALAESYFTHSSNNQDYDDAAANVKQVSTLLGDVFSTLVGTSEVTDLVDELVDWVRQSSLDLEGTSQSVLQLLADFDITARCEAHQFKLCYGLQMQRNAVRELLPQIPNYATLSAAGSYRNSFDHLGESRRSGNNESAPSGGVGGSGGIASTSETLETSLADVIFAVHRLQNVLTLSHMRLAAGCDIALPVVRAHWASLSSKEVIVSTALESLHPTIPGIHGCSHEDNFPHMAQIPFVVDSFSELLFNVTSLTITKGNGGESSESEVSALESHCANLIGVGVSQHNFRQYQRCLLQILHQRCDNKSNRNLRRATSDSVPILHQQAAWESALFLIGTKIMKTFKSPMGILGDKLLLKAWKTLPSNVLEALLKTATAEAETISTYYLKRESGGGAGSVRNARSADRSPRGGAGVGSKPGSPQTVHESSFASDDNNNQSANSNLNSSSSTQAAQNNLLPQFTFYSSLAASLEQVLIEKLQNEKAADLHRNANDNSNSSKGKAAAAARNRRSTVVFNVQVATATAEEKRDSIVRAVAVRHILARIGPVETNLFLALLTKKALHEHHAAILAALNTLLQPANPQFPPVSVSGTGEESTAAASNETNEFDSIESQSKSRLQESAASAINSRFQLTAANNKLGALPQHPLLFKLIVYSNSVDEYMRNSIKITSSTYRQVCDIFHDSFQLPQSTPAAEKRNSLVASITKRLLEQAPADIECGGGGVGLAASGGGAKANESSVSVPRQSEPLAVHTAAKQAFPTQFLLHFAIPTVVHSVYRFFTIGEKNFAGTQSFGLLWKSEMAAMTLAGLNAENIIDVIDMIRSHLVESLCMQCTTNSMQPPKSPNTGGTISPQLLSPQQRHVLEKSFNSMKGSLSASGGATMESILGMGGGGGTPSQQSLAFAQQIVVICDFIDILKQGFQVLGSISTTKWATAATRGLAKELGFNRESIWLHFRSVAFEAPEIKILAADFFSEEQRKIARKRQSTVSPMAALGAPAAASSSGQESYSHSYSASGVDSMLHSAAEAHLHLLFSGFIRVAQMTVEECADSEVMADKAVSSLCAAIAAELVVGCYNSFRACIFVGQFLSTHYFSRNANWVNLCGSIMDFLKNQIVDVFELFPPYTRSQSRAVVRVHRALSETVANCHTDSSPAQNDLNLNAVATDVYRCAHTFITTEGEVIASTCRRKNATHDPALFTVPWVLQFYSTRQKQTALVEIITWLFQLLCEVVKTSETREPCDVNSTIFSDAEDAIWTSVNSNGFHPWTLRHALLVLRDIVINRIKKLNENNENLSQHASIRMASSQIFSLGKWLFDRRTHKYVEHLQYLTTPHARTEFRNRINLVVEHIPEIIERNRNEIFHHDSFCFLMKRESYAVAIHDVLKAVQPYLHTQLIQSAAASGGTHSDAELSMSVGAGANPHKSIPNFDPLVGNKELVPALDAILSSGMCLDELQAFASAAVKFLDEHYNSQISSHIKAQDGEGGGGNNGNGSNLARRKRSFKFLTKIAMEIEINKTTFALLSAHINHLYTVVLQGLDMYKFLARSATPSTPSGGTGAPASSSGAAAADVLIPLTSVPSAIIARGGTPGNSALTSTNSMALMGTQVHSSLTGGLGAGAPGGGNTTNSTLLWANIQKIEPHAKQLYGTDAQLRAIMDSIANSKDDSLIDFWMKSSPIVKGFINTRRAQVGGALPASDDSHSVSVDSDVAFFYFRLRNIHCHRLDRALNITAKVLREASAYFSTQLQRLKATPGLERTADILNDVLVINGELLTGSTAGYSLLALFCKMAPLQLSVLAEALVGRWGSTYFEIIGHPQKMNHSKGQQQQQLQNKQPSVATTPVEQQGKQALTQALRSIRIAVQLLIEIKKPQTQKLFATNIDFGSMSQALVSNKEVFMESVINDAQEQSLYESSATQYVTSLYNRLFEFAQELCPPPPPTQSGSGGGSNAPIRNVLAVALGRKSRNSVAEAQQEERKASSHGSDDANIGGLSKDEARLTKLLSWFETTDLYLDCCDKEQEMFKVFDQLVRCVPFREGKTAEDLIVLLMLCAMHVRDEHANAENRYFLTAAQTKTLESKCLIEKSLSETFIEWWAADTPAETKRKANILRKIKELFVTQQDSGNRADVRLPAMAKATYRVIQSLVIQYSNNLSNGVAVPISVLTRRFHVQRFQDRDIMFLFHLMASVFFEEPNCPRVEMLDFMATLGKTCSSAPTILNSQYEGQDHQDALGYSSSLGAASSSRSKSSSLVGPAALSRTSSVNAEHEGSICSSSSHGAIGGNTSSSAVDVTGLLKKELMGDATISVAIPHDDLKLLSFVWLKILPEVSKFRRLFYFEFIKSVKQRGLKIDDRSKAVLHKALRLVHEISLLYESVLNDSTATTAQSDATSEDKNASPRLLGIARSNQQRIADEMAKGTGIGGAIGAQHGDGKIKGLSKPVAKLLSKFAMETADDTSSPSSTQAAPQASAAANNAALLPEEQFFSFVSSFVDCLAAIVPKIMTQTPSNATIRSLRFLGPLFCDFQLREKSAAGGVESAAASANGKGTSPLQQRVPSPPASGSPSRTVSALLVPKASPVKQTVATLPAPTSEPASSSGKPTYTKREVAKHNSASDCWIILNKKVYNFTAFVDRHPGGAAMVSGSAGADGTSIFNLSHDKGSSMAFANIAKYEIGSLAE